MMLSQEKETPKLNTWAFSYLLNSRRLVESSNTLLRETHENSNYILLRIPVEIHLFERGLQGICICPRRLRELLGPCDQGVESLCKAGRASLPTSQPSACGPGQWHSRFATKHVTNSQFVIGAIVRCPSTSVSRVTLQTPHEMPSQSRRG